MKADRDANFVAANKDGTTVNRWTTTGFLAASATTNETAFMTYKVVRSTGALVFDNQARVSTARRWPVWLRRLAVVQ